MFRHVRVLAAAVAGLTSLALTAQACPPAPCGSSYGYSYYSPSYSRGYDYAGFQQGPIGFPSRSFAPATPRFSPPDFGQPPVDPGAFAGRSFSPSTPPSGLSTSRFAPGIGSRPPAPVNFAPSGPIGGGAGFRPGVGSLTGGGGPGPFVAGIPQNSGRSGIDTTPGGNSVQRFQIQAPGSGGRPPVQNRIPGRRR